MERVALQRRLGASDRARVGDYLDTVREVERRIQKAEQHQPDLILLDISLPDWLAMSRPR